MLAPIIFSASYLIFMACTLWILKPFRNASPFFWFIVAQGVMAVGTFAMIDASKTSDIVYALLFFLALIVFFISCFIFSSQFKIIRDLKRFSDSPTVDDGNNAKLFSTSMFLFCVLLSAIYYNAVGYNLLALLIFDGGVEDYSTMRIAAYSASSGAGDQYLAPGYVNQFKNVLLPITAAAIAIWLRQSRHPLLFFGFCLFAVPIVVLAIAGTGQRGYLFFTSGALVFSFVLHSLGRRGVNLRRAALWGTPVLALFLVMTGAYYGKADQGVLTLLRDTVLRFSSIQQEGGLVGFRYIYELEPQWFTDWLKALLGVLPGFDGSMVAHDIHALMYGTFRGTVPLSPIGSGYYNGRIIGVILLFGVLGFFYVQAYRLYLKGPRTILRSLCYGFMFFYMTIYLADSPVSLIDGGVLAIIIFLWLVQIFSGRHHIRTRRGLVDRHDVRARTP